MVQYFIDGGAFMWPILISLVFGLGFAFERAYSLLMSSINSQKFYDDIKGKIIKKFLSCFNSKTGIFFLACALKITKPLFKKVLSYNEENIPSPSINIFPAVGSVSLDIHLNKVDFPEPVRPMITTNSPRCMFKEILLKTC